MVASIGLGLRSQRLQLGLLASSIYSTLHPLFSVEPGFPELGQPS
ncbi:hypothetical protein [Neosynechococcus sphagnicola]|nr:hypothetical protein [Neosynechococcus sphagnicola]